MKGKPRMFKVAIVASVTLFAVATPSEAQEVGNRVRVRTEEGQEWTTGTLVDLSPAGTLALSPALGQAQLHFELPEIYRADWYKNRSLAGRMLLGLVGGAGAQLAFPCEPSEGTCLTDTKGGDVALFAGIGLTAGLLFYLIKPGDWKEWISGGRITVK